MNARAAAIWSRVATSTERPASSSSPSPKLMPPAPDGKWPRRTLAAAPHTNRRWLSGALASVCRIDGSALSGVFIQPDEITQRHRVGHCIGFRERIESQRLFEPRDEDGDGERVEPRIEQHQVISQRREALMAVVRDLLDLRNHSGLD